MIDIVHRFTKAILYHSETAQTIAEAVAEAAKNDCDLRGCDLSGCDLRGCDLRGCDLRDSDLRGCDLRDSNLSGCDLRGCDLRRSNLRGCDLSGCNFPAEYRIANICFGGWPVTVTPTETSIGCERHPNKAWLSWAAAAPEIAKMHPDATAWWTRHRESVCAVIRDVMQP